MAGGALAGTVPGRFGMAAFARALGRMPEDELGARCVAGLAGRCLDRRSRVLMSRIVAGIATGRGQVVAARALDRHMSGQVRLARVGEGLVRPRGGGCLIGQHARLFEGGGAHLVTGRVVAALTGAL